MFRSEVPFRWADKTGWIQDGCQSDVRHPLSSPSCHMNVEGHMSQCQDSWQVSCKEPEQEQKGVVPRFLENLYLYPERIWISLLLGQRFGDKAKMAWTKRSPPFNLTRNLCFQKPAKKHGTKPAPISGFQSDQWT